MIVEYNNELIELDDSQDCSCCGKVSVVKETNMCPACIELAYKVFYEARFNALRRNLMGERLEKFEAMTLSQKQLLVNRLIKKGLMI